jgi:hypothetical protein
MEEMSSMLRTRRRSDEELVMDIKGAKALKKRLGLDGADEAPPAAEPADVPADAPPVYHWTGIPPAESSAVDEDEGPAAAAGTAFFRRLGLSSR